MFIFDSSLTGDIKMVKTIVKKAKYGKGLFADEDIKHVSTRVKKDRVVVARFKFETKTEKQWDKHVAKWKIPYDSGMQWYDTVHYDPNMLSTGHTAPKWYRLNHSFNFANVEMVKYKDEIRWVTLQDIQKGEEIRFKYFVADPAWSEDD